MKITWLGQGGFLLESQGFRLVVDPYISNCVFQKEGLARLHPFPVPMQELKPDLVLVTHDHMDHLDPEEYRWSVRLIPNAAMRGRSVPTSIFSGSEFRKRLSHRSR